MSNNKPNTQNTSHSYLLLIIVIVGLPLYNKKGRKRLYTTNIAYYYNINLCIFSLKLIIRWFKYWNLVIVRMSTKKI